MICLGGIRDFGPPIYRGKNNFSPVNHAYDFGMTQGKRPFGGK